jgi:hypothetical protein
MRNGSRDSRRYTESRERLEKDSLRIGCLQSRFLVMKTRTCPLLVDGAQCGEKLTHVAKVRGKQGCVVELMECSVGHRVVVDDIATAQGKLDIGRVAVATPTNTLLADKKIPSR